MQSYTRNLPHYYPHGATFFITYRLFGSIPLIELKKLRSEFVSQKQNLFRLYRNDLDYTEKLYSLQKKHFLLYDTLLDKAIESPQWLCEDSIAKLVSDKMLEFDSLKYDLIVFCIMPNHVHFVIHPNEDLTTNISNLKGKTKEYIVADIMRLIKGSTARDSNLILGKTGSFWQHESYDHIVRNENELNNIILYVLNNPVKAGLVTDWKDWKWSYCKYDVLF